MWGHFLLVAVLRWSLNTCFTIIDNNVYVYITEWPVQLYSSLCLYNTSDERTPPMRGHLRWEVTSDERTPPMRGHLRWEDTSTTPPICQPRWLSGRRRSLVHSLMIARHCVLRNWNRILVRAVKGFISRAGMVSICPLLWQRDVKLQQTKQHLRWEDTSDERTPLMRGHLWWEDTSDERTPPMRGHLRWEDTSVLWNPFNLWKYIIIGPSDERTPPIKGHLPLKDTSH